MPPRATVPGPARLGSARARYLGATGSCTVAATSESTWVQPALEIERSGLKEDAAVN